LGLDKSVDKDSIGYQAGDLAGTFCGVGGAAKGAYGAGKTVYKYAKYGQEVKFGKNLRVAPFGNRTGHKIGRYPHYHRRGAPGPNGKTPDGQGIGRHRPWENSQHDKCWKDRF
jgi:hypothetical protein